MQYCLYHIVSCLQLHGIAPISLAAADKWLSWGWQLQFLYMSV